MKRRVGLSSILGPLLFVLQVGAAEVGVKSLSGPPDDFSAHRLTSARDVSVPSKILMLDRGQREREDGEAVAPGTTYSSFSTTSGVGFSLVQITTYYPTFSPATITAPNGARYHFDGSTITCNSGACGLYQADLQMEAFTTKAPGGVAIFSISGGEVSGGTWQLALQSPAPLPVAAATTLQVDSLISFDDNVVGVTIEPEPCKLYALCPEEPRSSARRNQLFDLVQGASPVLSVFSMGKDVEGREAQGGVKIAALELTVTETRTRGMIHQEVYGPTRAANLPVNSDGHSLVQLPSLPEGEYSVRLDVEGEVPGVGKIERTLFYYLPIIARSYELTRDVRAEVIDDERLEIQLGVEALTSQTSHVYAYAEIWTRDGKEPIAWVGGMTSPGYDRSGRLGLPMVFDARWLALAKKSDSAYLLRNVRIQDPDTFIPIDQIEELPFDAPQLPRAASLTPTQVIKDDTLYFGKGDRTIFAHDLEPTAPSRGGLFDTGILLVHGWCSNPAWPVGDFINPGRIGGTAVFSDPGASRSHDSFAQRISVQGDASFIDSFSVVAHSQGGAAATHLRAFYTSLLDNSTAPRRIQSMGTPYGGSTLMDYYLATGLLGWLVAEIIGECTAQFDLGTLGSVLWSLSIPSSVRNDVFFFRTRHTRPSNFWQRLQFWRWRCNAASFVIPSADDGVVADFQGHFSGAHNMGITDGECHIGGMNHPDQKDNVARNDVMDREGRPQPVPLQAVCRVQAIWHPSGGPTGQGYHEYWVNASDSTPGNFPIATFTWSNGGFPGSPTTSSTYGPLFPGLPGQASSYTITVVVTDTSGATASATCRVP